MTTSVCQSLVSKLTLIFGDQDYLDYNWDTIMFDRDTGILSQLFGFDTSNGAKPDATWQANPQYLLAGGQGFNKFMQENNVQFTTEEIQFLLNLVARRSLVFPENMAIIDCAALEAIVSITDPSQTDAVVQNLRQNVPDLFIKEKGDNAGSDDEEEGGFDPSFDPSAPSVGGAFNVDLNNLTIPGTANPPGFQPPSGPVPQPAPSMPQFGGQVVFPSNLPPAFVPPSNVAPPTNFAPTFPNAVPQTNNNVAPTFPTQNEPVGEAPYFFYAIRGGGTTEQEQNLVLDEPIQISTNIKLPNDKILNVQIFMTAGNFGIQTGTVFSEQPGVQKGNNKQRSRIHTENKQAYDASLAASRANNQHPMIPFQLSDGNPGPNGASGVVGAKKITHLKVHEPQYGDLDMNKTTPGRVSSGRDKDNVMQQPSQVNFSQVPAQVNFAPAATAQAPTQFWNALPVQPPQQQQQQMQQTQQQQPMSGGGQRVRQAAYGENIEGSNVNVNNALAIQVEGLDKGTAGVKKWIVKHPNGPMPVGYDKKYYYFVYPNGDLVRSEGSIFQYGDKGSQLRLPGDVENNLPAAINRLTNDLGADFINTFKRSTISNTSNQPKSGRKFGNTFTGGVTSMPQPQQNFNQVGQFQQATQFQPAQTPAFQPAQTPAFQPTFNPVPAPAPSAAGLFGGQFTANPATLFNQTPAQPQFQPAPTPQFNAQPQFTSQPAPTPQFQPTALTNNAPGQLVNFNLGATTPAFAPPGTATTPMFAPPAQAPTQAPSTVFAPVFTPQ